MGLHKEASLCIVFLPERETPRQAHAELHELYMARKPVTFFALECDLEAAKKIVKPDFERFRWAPRMSGARADELLANEESILDSTRAVTVISQIPEFEPIEAADYNQCPRQSHNM